jgi:hypothetical protein
MRRSISVTFLLALAFQVFQELDDFFILLNEGEVGFHHKFFGGGDFFQIELRTVAIHRRVIVRVGVSFHGLEPITV